MGKRIAYNDEKVFKMLQSTNERTAAIALLYEHYKDAIYKYVLQTGGASGDAEEIVFSSLVTTVSNIDQGRFEGRSRLSTYFVAIGKNLWRTELRKQKRSFVPIEETDMGFMPDFQEEADRRDRLLRLRQCIAGLGDTCKQLVSIWKLSEPTPAWPEIAHQMGFSSVQVAKNQGQRCMKRLRKCMGAAA